MIEKGAKLLNKKLKGNNNNNNNNENFIASEDCLQRFKIKYEIPLISISSEKLSAQQELVQPFNDKLIGKN